MTPARALDEGYLAPRYLDDWRVGALHRYLFTTAIVILGEEAPTHRWCYADTLEAVQAFAGWSGAGDPPGNWIKQKLPVERLNPNWSRS